MFAASKSGSVADKDPQFNYVTMLLHGDGTNGAQNNTFLDSSTNNFTITRNGNTTQGSFSPYGSNWSNFFSGTSGQYLNTVANAVFSFGTGDFTVEGWVFPTGTNTGAPMPIVEIRTNATNTTGFAFMREANALTLNVYQNGYKGASTGSLTFNAWNHVALVRSGNTWTYWINGVSSGSFTNSTNLTDGATTGPKIGGSSTAGEVWIGYLSNIRIVKGTAVYTTAFTPSATPLTAISGTSLLTCADNRFIDDSTNAFAITVNGSPSVQRFNPFGAYTPYSTSVIGGSGYFDGTGDFLTTPSNAAYQFGTGDFTIEYWIYQTALGSYRTVLDTRASGTATPWACLINSSNQPYILLTSDLTSSIALNINSWNHVAIVRSGTNLSIYVNGVSGLSTTNSTNISPTGSLRVGYTVDSQYFAIGYLSNIRIVKGTAVYTAAFTPPTAPLTAITNTSILLNYTNGAIFDNAMINDFETRGNAQISTSVKKYGTGSLAFDGTGDYLITPSIPDNRLNTTGNFTIEFWAYFNSVASGQRLIAWDNDSNNFVIALYTNTSGTLHYYISSTGTTWNIASAVSVGSIATSTWYHIALVRNGSVFTPYINGTAGTTTTNASALYSSTLPFAIGATGTGTSGFNGYIDDLRITKGYARYTAAFTAPTKAFPNN